MDRSSAAQVIIAIIPIVGILMGGVVVFFYLLWNHKCKQLLIQTKQWAPVNFDLYLFSLLAGLLLSIVGLGLTVFLAIVLGADYGLLGGLIPLSCGIALLTFFLIKHREKQQR